MNKYNKIRKLGEGGFGAAWLVELPPTKDKYVIKSVNCRNAKQVDLEFAKKEAEILKKLRHPNIVRYIDSFIEAGNFHIVMEFADGGDLQGIIDKKSQSRTFLSEKEILNYFVQILLALKHLHSKHILHRDLKPQNVFLTKTDVVKLGDLGIAKPLNSTKDLARTQIGTPYYFSPELCKNQPYNRKSDIWSLGIILYQLITNKVPFSGHSMQTLVNNILYVQYPPLPTTTSTFIKKFVSDMLNKTSTSRPEVDDLLKSKEVQNHIREIIQSKNIGPALLNPTDKEQPGLTYVRPFMEKEKKSEEKNNIKYNEVDRQVYKDILEREKSEYQKEKNVLKSKIELQEKEIYKLHQDKERLIKDIENERNLKNEKDKRILILEYEREKERLKLEEDEKIRKLQSQQKNIIIESKDKDLQYMRENEKELRHFKEKQMELEKFKLDLYARGKQKELNDRPAIPKPKNINKLERSSSFSDLLKPRYLPKPQDDQKQRNLYQKKDEKVGQNVGRQLIPYPSLDDNVSNQKRPSLKEQHESKREEFIRKQYLENKRLADNAKRRIKLMEEGPEYKPNTPSSREYKQQINDFKDAHNQRKKLENQQVQIKQIPSQHGVDFVKERALLEKKKKQDDYEEQLRLAREQHKRDMKELVNKRKEYDSPQSAPRSSEGRSGSASHASNHISNNLPNNNLEKVNDKINEKFNQIRELERKENDMILENATLRQNKKDLKQKIISREKDIKCADFKVESDLKVPVKIENEPSHDPELTSDQVLLNALLQEREVTDDKRIDLINNAVNEQEVSNDPKKIDVIRIPTPNQYHNVPSKVKNSLETLPQNLVENAFKMGSVWK